MLAAIRPHASGLEYHRNTVGRITFPRRIGRLDTVLHLRLLGLAGQFGYFVIDGIQQAPRPKLAAILVAALDEVIANIPTGRTVGGLVPFECNRTRPFGNGRQIGRLVGWLAKIVVVLCVSEKKIVALRWSVGSLFPPPHVGPFVPCCVVLLLAGEKISHNSLPP